MNYFIIMFGKKCRGFTTLDILLDTLIRFFKYMQYIQSKLDISL